MVHMIKIFIICTTNDEHYRNVAVAEVCRQLSERIIQFLFFFSLLLLFLLLYYYSDDDGV